MKDQAFEQHPLRELWPGLWGEVDLGIGSQGGKRRGWQSQASASHRRVSGSVPEPSLVSPVIVLPGLSAAASHLLSEPSPHWKLGDEYAMQRPL